MPVLLRPSVKTEAAATNFEGFVYYCPKRKTNCVVFKGKSEWTYKQADEHVLFGVVHASFIVVLVVLFGHQRQTGVRDVVVIEAAVETAGRLVAVETVFQITRMAAGGIKIQDSESVYLPPC